MHCCALLRGVCLLTEARLSTQAGILERSHLETWLVSLYVLLGGKKALDEVRSDYVHHVGRLAKNLEMGSEYVPEWKGKPRKLDLYRLSKSLDQLLIEAGEPGDGTAVKIYKNMYSVQSHFAVHAGISTTSPYIRTGEASWSAEPKPPAPFNDSSLTLAFLTLNLTKHVLDRCGIATDAVDAAWNDLSAYGKSRERRFRKFWYGKFQRFWHTLNR